MTALEASYDFELVHVTSADDLVALLDKVSALKYPTWLELSSPDDAILSIGLGAEFSTLRFYEDGLSGEIYHSSPTLAEPHVATFQMGEQPTHMDDGSAIGVEEARAAAIEFQRTGRRPEVVAWTVVPLPEEPAS
ncbi:Imm1 family immunity protein [Kribbella sp. NBC_01505]|uniref:Imm1 family immunity protein n=1 Tax=Kribbella sp. NBC_01505 TaxID=2903580 RepID=UPI00386E38D3